MFPEVLVNDIIESTNNEKYKLSKLAGLTTDMEMFTSGQSFSPSSCHWVFDWYFHKALSILLPKKVRECT
jgi:hypothetical protein